uniref:Kelch like family member 10 n=1 Tax=Neogobius melanostomus TaxID=47308 RepID=A0A8C6S1K3_9GOBI
MSSPESLPQTRKTLLDKMRRKNVLCDAVLEVGNDTFPVHKVILCSSSNFFRAMFVRGEHNRSKEFRIGGISSEVMALVLDYIYTECVTVSENNVQDLVMAAKMLNLIGLVQMCFKFMQGQLCPGNCIGIWRFSDFVISPDTRDLAWRYIMNHFEEVVVCEKFQELTVQELISITEATNLTNAKWIVILTIFFCLFQVRLSQIPLEYMRTKVVHNTLVENNYDCLNTVANSVSLVRPRLPGAVLLAIGGWSRDGATNAIEAFDHKADRWVNVTNPQERPRVSHGSVYFKGSVYCVGGFDGMEVLNSMRRLDMVTRTWHEMPSMYHRRDYVSITVLRDCIYAIGGCDDGQPMNTVEVFDLEANQWSQITSMTEHRGGANCATLNGKIYICGGFNGTECLQTAECYDPETDQWTMIAPMTFPRRDVAVIAYAGQIYAVGGYDGYVHLDSAETYNPRNNTWREVASMHNPRSNFGIEVLDDRIFTVGGFNGFFDTCSVESYDHLLNTWTDVCGMDVIRSCLNCCVISGLANMSDYTVSRDTLPLLDIGSDPLDEEELD